MNTTTNFNLRKPEPIDFYSVEDQNANMDKIDETLSKMPQISDIEDVPVPILENARVYTTVDNNGQALAPRTVASAVTYGATNVEQALNSLIASGNTPYSADSTYALGAYCSQSGVMYKCTTAITVAEAWNAAHWTETSVGAEIAAAYTALAAHTGNTSNPHGVTPAQIGAMPLKPALIELTPPSDGGFGGAIDFHFNGSTADYTSRIIEYQAGAIDIVGDLTNNSKHVATTSTLTATVPVAWTASGNFFYQNVSVPGMLATDNPVADVLMWTDNAANKLYAEAWAKVLRIDTGDNLVQIWCTEVPTVAFQLQFKVVR